MSNLLNVMVISWMMSAVEGFLFARKKRLLSNHVGEITPVGVLTIVWYLWLGCHFIKEIWNARDRSVLRRWVRASQDTRAPALGVAQASRLS